jgi:nucleotide-binding universal stress UspA family protein
VQVVQPAGGEDLSYGERTPAQILREEGLREDHAKLEALAASAAPTAEVVQVRALERPSTELCRVAEEMDATAVVVGTHGRSGVARFFLGSTAERLLRHATRPVLVLREAPTTASPWYEPPILPATHLGPRRMLVAVDFSEPSKRAIAFARSLAAKLRIAVEVVHVYDAIVAGASSAPGAPANEVRAMLTTRLDELVRDVFGPDASTVRTHLVPGRPIDAILDLARKREADLVVVGTTGRTGIERMLLGSTAERLVRESAVPILTIH